MLRRRKELACALIAEAVHADIAVRLRQFGCPLHRSRAVEGLVHERIERAFAVTSAADILRDHQIARTGEHGWVRRGDGRRDLAAVGGSHYERGKRARAHRVPQVGHQRGAIAGAHGDTAPPLDHRHRS